MTIRSLLLLALVATGCDETFVPEPLAPEAFEPVVQTLSLQLSAAPGFGDERGGGIFIDLAGRVVRVRPNGARGVLESHPRNEVWPGRATAVYPLGPFNALVATDRGFFVVDQGWLIAPAWRGAVDASGLLGVTLGEGGVAWLAHADGLYRLDNGVLTEFKLGEERLPGVTALGLAPTLDSTPGIWFCRDGKLFAGAQTSRTQFQVQEVTLSADALAGGIVGLAGIAPGRDSGGELWVATRQGLLLYTGQAWRQYTLPASPRQLLAAGRFAWLLAGDALYRYDGDTRRWAEVKGLAAAPTLVAADTAGTAWVRVGSETLAVSRNAAPRVAGLYQGARVFDGQLVLQATVPADAAPEALSWAIDDGAPQEVDLTKGVEGSGPTAGLVFHSLGGVEAGGILRPVSLASLANGRHILSVTATKAGVSATRRVHFEFLGAATATVSWETQVRALGDARCGKCHSAGVEPELTTYEQWRDWAPAIAAAVRDRRMPADGPLDQGGIQTIIRWVNGGALP
jgi:hypothetical protein